MKLVNFVTGTPAAAALGWTLFHSLWEGLIIAAVFAALLVSARSPRVRYVAGCAALLALLASFAVTLIHFLPESNSGARSLVKVIFLPSGALGEVKSNNSRLSDLAALVPWLAPLWLVGVSLFYLRYSAGWLSLYRLRRRGVCKTPDTWQRRIRGLTAELKVSRPVLLLESLLADTPVVLGHFRPVVLVPLGFLAGLPPDHVEAILLHELAHIRRSDYLINVCQRLIEGLLFYHPAVWWISSVIRAERENCCDDVVVALRGNAHGYAMALAALEQNRFEQQWPESQPAVAATGGNLMKRVKRLLYPKNPNGIWAPALAAIVLMASTAMLLSAWHVNAGQTDNKVDGPWQKWLNEDVVYIISDEEKAAFERQKTDKERQHFVEEFWARRDPTPETPANEYKEEHYRRIAYANSHFAYAPDNLPGWQTDRGRVYIKFGPPDEIDSHPAGGGYDRPASEGGGHVTTYPFEDWRYSHFEGVGSLTIEYIDTTLSGNWRMTLDPNEKYKKP